MPLPKRMERAPTSPVSIKQEPIEQKEEILRNEEDLNETIVISDSDGEYDPLVNLYPDASRAPEQDEDGILLHPDEGDLAIDELDYEPADRGESILDEVILYLTKTFLDTRRPFRMTRGIDVKRFIPRKNKTRNHEVDEILFIFILNLAIYYYTIYTISKPFVAVDSLFM